MCDWVHDYILENRPIKDTNAEIHFLPVDEGHTDALVGFVITTIDTSNNSMMQPYARLTMYKTMQIYKINVG